MDQTLQSKRGWVAVNRIKVRSPFKDLFVIDEKTLKSIAEHMQANGYDEAQPIVVWDRTEAEQNKHALYVLDGHTRLQAAKSIHLSPVYIARMKFPSEDEALQYAIHNQRDRRNLSDGDLLRCIEAVDQTKQRGGDHTTEKAKASLDAIDKGKSSEETARIVGASPRKVEKARTVRQHADEETKGAVLDGKKSIHQAYVETQEKRRNAAAARLSKYKEESTALFQLKRWWRRTTKKSREQFFTYTMEKAMSRPSDQGASSDGSLVSNIGRLWVCPCCGRESKITKEMITKGERRGFDGDLS